jgi:hypothetical protein
MWATFDGQPLLFARYSSLQEGMWLRPSGVGGRSYDWLSPDFPRCGRGTKWRRALKDVVSAEKRIGPESRRPAGQHRSVSRRVSRFHRSDAFPSGSKDGLITTRREIINTGAELIDIGRVRIRTLDGGTGRHDRTSTVATRSLMSSWNDAQASDAGGVAAGRRKLTFCRPDTLRAEPRAVVGFPESAAGGGGEQSLHYYRITTAS